VLDYYKASRTAKCHDGRTARDYAVLKKHADIVTFFDGEPEDAGAWWWWYMMWWYPWVVIPWLVIPLGVVIPLGGGRGGPVL
jgi:hypothetical protein